MIKSPMIWPGNKYKQLNQLYSIFPKDINNFIDLFCGGLDVSININASNKYANDINKNIIDIYQAFQKQSLEQLMEYIDLRIQEFALSRFNTEGFLQYRELYNTNSSYHTPIDLFILSRFSYNNEIRINTYNEFTGSFGFNRSDFNIIQRNHTKNFYYAIQNIKFSSKNFRDFDFTSLGKNDFIYVDPPYLISYVQYTRGSRKNNSCWTEQDDIDLFSYLDRATQQGIRWALSNFIAHKGRENINLIKWAEQYNTYDIYQSYSNSYASKKKNNDFTLEMLITNY